MSFADLNDVRLNDILFTFLDRICVIFELEETFLKACFFILIKCFERFSLFFRNYMCWTKCKKTLRRVPKTRMER